MFGLQTNAEKHEVTFAPHVPVDWTSFAIHNARIESGTVDFQYRKSADSIVLETKQSGTSDCWVDFSPALSLRAEVTGVQMNGKPLPFKVQANGNDQHVNVRFQVKGEPRTVVIHVKNDFGIALANELPAQGSSSRGLRELSESWNSSKTQLTLEVSGLAGSRYELGVWNSGQISSVEGAALSKNEKLQIQMPGAGSDSYVQQKIVIHFGKP
jgi:hypothetical protein